MQKGEINLTLEGASLSETERCRLIIETLFRSGAFNVRRGKVVLSFDHHGILGRVDFEVQAWTREDDKRRGNIPVVKRYEDVKIN